MILDRRAVVVVWRDVKGWGMAGVVGFESLVGAFDDVMGGSVVVKDWRVVRAVTCDSVERRLGSMEWAVGLVARRGGRRGSEVGGGRRRDSQACFSVWRLGMRRR